MAKKRKPTARGKTPHGRKFSQQARQRIFDETFERTCREGVLDLSERQLRTVQRLLQEDPALSVVRPNRRHLRPFIEKFTSEAIPGGTDDHQGGGILQRAERKSLERAFDDVVQAAIYDAIRDATSRAAGVDDIRVLAMMTAFAFLTRRGELPAAENPVFRIFAYQTAAQQLEEYLAMMRAGADVVSVFTGQLSRADVHAAIAGSRSTRDLLWAEVQNDLKRLYDGIASGRIHATLPRTVVEPFIDRIEDRSTNAPFDLAPEELDALGPEVDAFLDALDEQAGQTKGWQRTELGALASVARTAHDGSFPMLCRIVLLGATARLRNDEDAEPSDEAPQE
jgi:hypothetical protein